MLHQFVAHVNRQHLLPTGKEVLLAVSGGIDSVVLAHLMHQAGFPFAIAHCNFHLRPCECDRDEAFVRQLAQQYSIGIHVAQFDTLTLAKERGQSIEEAARQLRYDWFRQLCNQHGYAAILTAHHRDDSTETFFINLLRGTGLTGLHGILPVQGMVVRPLLPFGREEIEAYAQQEGLQHVEDSTNASLNYRRNQIRHQLLPLLRQLQPSADRSLASTIGHLQSTEQLYQALLQPYHQSLISLQQDGTIVVSLNLPPLPAPTATQLLFELLRPYDFHYATAQAILASSTPGRQFHSPTHIALLDREQLLIVEKEREPLNPNNSSTIPQHNNSTQHLPCQTANLSIEIFDAEELNASPTLNNSTTQQLDSPTTQQPDNPTTRQPNNPTTQQPNNSTTQQLNTSSEALRHLPPNQALFDADTVRLPLSLRHWRQGDRFRPLGMEKGSQLLSDYFSDHKYSLLDKQRQLLLVDADDTILWIVGRRTSHPHRITPSTLHLLRVTLN